MSHQLITASLLYLAASLLLLLASHSHQYLSTAITTRTPSCLRCQEPLGQDVAPSGTGHATVSLCEDCQWYGHERRCFLSKSLRIAHRGFWQYRASLPPAVHPGETRPKKSSSPHPGNCWLHMALSLEDSYSSVSGRRVSGCLFGLRFVGFRVV